MRLIAAVDRHWGIGKDGGLLFHIPEDMRRFKEKTMGGTLIMGGATLRSLPGGKPLAGRRSIVLTRKDTDSLPEGVVVRASVEQVLREASLEDQDRTWVIGGASVYEALAPYCAGALITKVDALREPDRRMPDLDALPSWRVASQEGPFESGGLSFRFVEYVNDDPWPMPGR